MTARTANDILKARVGDLVFENSNLQAENEALRDKLVEVGRMLPPDLLEKAKLKILEGKSPGGDGEDAESVPPPEV